MRCRFSKDILTLFQEELDLVKGISVNKRSVGHGGVEHILLTSISELFEGDCGVAVGFLIFAIAAIPLISKDVCHLGGAPGGFPSFGFDAAAVEIPGDLRCRLAAQVVFEHHADDGRLRFIDHQRLIHQPEAVRSVAVHIFPRLHPLHDGKPLVLGNCLRLLLCDGREGIEQHLISEGQGVDSLFLKLHPHAEQFQLPDIFQRLLGVSGETGDGFGDDQVDLVLFAHLDHSLEFGAVLCVHAREPFVSEYLHQLPLFFSLNEAGIYPNLVGVGVLLISRIGRYPAIGGDSNFADFLPGDGRDEFDLRHQQPSFLAEFWIVLHFGTIHFSGSSNIIVNGKAKSIERTQRSIFLHKRQDLMPKIHQFRRFLLNI